jgi:hypothetical protein
MSDFNPRTSDAEPTRALVATDLKELLDRPIAYHRIFARVGGGPLAGIFLSQAIYWSQRTNDPDGWFYKTRGDWFLETELTRRHQETARRNLRQVGVLEERLSGVPAQLYFRVNLGQLQKLITDLLDGKKSVPASRAESAQQEGTKRANKKGAFAPAIKSETTSENSSETTSSSEEEEILDSLIKRAVEIGANKKRVEAAIRANPIEAAKQLDFFPDRENIKAPGAALLTAIEQSWPPPPKATERAASAADRAQRAAQIQKAQSNKDAEKAREKSLVEESKMLDQLFADLPEDEREELIEQAKRRTAPLAALGRVPKAALDAERRNLQRREMGLPVDD